MGGSADRQGQWCESTTSGFAYSEGVNITSPVFVRKMSGLNTASANNYEASGVHIYDFRYAELQLNLAECYAATNQIDLCKQAANADARSNT